MQWQAQGRSQERLVCRVQKSRGQQESEASADILLQPCGDHWVIGSGNREIVATAHNEKVIIHYRKIQEWKGVYSRTPATELRMRLGIASNEQRERWRSAVGLQNPLTSVVLIFIILYLRCWIFRFNSTTETL